MKSERAREILENFVPKTTEGQVLAEVCLILCDGVTALEEELRATRNAFNQRLKPIEDWKYIKERR